MQESTVQLMTLQPLLFGAWGPRDQGQGPNGPLGTQGSHPKSHRSLLPKLRIPYCWRAYNIWRITSGGGPYGCRVPTLNLMGPCSLNLRFLTAGERIRFGAAVRAVDDAAGPILSHEKLLPNRPGGNYGPQGFRRCSEDVEGSRRRGQTTLKRFQT